MISNKMTRAEMIKWLGDAIRTETEKPFDDIDHDFVDECSCLLVELMGETAVMTEEEIAARISKLNPDKATPKKTGVKPKRIWKIAIAAAVVLCMGITVLAVPALRTALMTALKLDVGESTEVNGLTYIYDGEVQKYESIEELIENENLDILLPRIQSETLKLTEILHVAETNRIFVRFNDATINYAIQLDNTDIDSYAVNSKEYSFNGYTTYVVTSELSGKLKYCSYTLINNDIHVMAVDNLETIELLVNSIH